MREFQVLHPTQIMRTRQYYLHELLQIHNVACSIMMFFNPLTSQFNIGKLCTLTIKYNKHNNVNEFQESAIRRREHYQLCVSVIVRVSVRVRVRVRVSACVCVCVRVIDSLRKHIAFVRQGSNQHMPTPNSVDHNQRRKQETKIQQIQMGNRIYSTLGRVFTLIYLSDSFPMIHQKVYCYIYSSNKRLNLIHFTM